MILKERSNSPIVKVVHAADIHIRNWKRHEEYNAVFEEFYKKLSLITEEYVIVVPGDIAHSKTDMSPELVHMISAFLTKLASFAPTFLICGNHDVNLNNDYRLDVLSPIVDALKLPNLYYLKKNGLYQYNNITFGAFSMIDSAETWPIEIPEKDPNQTYIALFHGAMNAAQLDSGLKLQTNHGLNMFVNYDMSLLGDIHSFQFLNKEKTIAYPSSLIQQNFGEDYENHGFLIWDIPSCTAEFHRIINEYGYFTLYVDSNKVVNPVPTEIGKKSRVRIKFKNTSTATLTKIADSLKRKQKVSDILIVNDVKGNFSSITNKDTAHLFDGDIRVLTFQNQLFKKYFKEKPPQKYINIKQLYSLNEEFNKQLPFKEIERNIVWKPKRLEFENMFSFGEGNVIDFTQCNGIYGILGPNAVGKSAILDILCFCAFDQCFRTYKAAQILNNKKDSFKCHLQFEINGQDYFITKTAKKLTGYFAGKVKVNIDFWTIDAQGEKVSLNGAERSDTDKIIQTYIGTFENFILTTLSLQNNNANFIDKSQSERKELLSKYLDLVIFDDLYKIANDELNRINILLKEHQKHDYTTILHSEQIQFKKLNKELSLNSEELLGAVSEMTAYKNRELELTSLLNENVQQINIEEILHEKTLLKGKINAKNEEIKKIGGKLHQFEQRVKIALKTLLTSEDIKECEKDADKSAVLHDELYKLEMQEGQLKAENKHLMGKLKNLSELEYDPNCKYCVNNIFVKDANDSKSRKEAVDKLLKMLQETIFEKKEQKELLRASTLKLLKNAEISAAIQSDERDINDCKSKIKQSDELIFSYKQQEKLLNEKQDLYKKQKAIIENNIVIKKQIDELHVDIELLSRRINKLESKKTELLSNIKVHQTTIESIEVKVKEVEEMLVRQDLLVAYCDAVSRDGIPYQLITIALPRLEAIINDILSQIVDFNIVLNTDGKNVNAFIAYKEQFWTLEMSSGMERFISSLAIRMALFDISALPKTNFIAIDEGMGVLDSTNLNSLYTLFNYIKTVFDFALIVTHIDSVKDMVDHTMAIEQNEGFSLLNCN